MSSSDRDMVDRIAGQWAAVRPDVDVSPMEIIGRISRLSRLVDRRLGQKLCPSRNRELDV